MAPDANAAVDTVYRTDWGRIVATLIRLGRDFDVAAEAAQEAFTAAVDQWRVSGVPDVPRAWIIQTARHKAIDRIRRRARFGERLDAYTAAGASLTVEAPEFDPGDIPDDRLRLIFTCCHPARRPARRCGRARPARSAGSPSLESRADRRGAAARGGGAARRPRYLRAPGGDRGPALSGDAGRRYGLAPDRPAL